MSDSVIIVVADDHYIEHAKALMGGCVNEGKWSGDFAVISPRGSNAAAEFASFGLPVLEIEERGFLQKFRVFDPFFKRWERALFMDCDVIVQDRLSRLFELLDAHDLYFDTEDGTTMGSFWRFPVTPETEPVYARMRSEFPWVDERTFNTAFVMYRPASMPAETPEQLMQIQAWVEPANRMTDDLTVAAGTDQQIINLLLWPRGKPILGKRVGFWGFGEPQNDIVSEGRGWVGGETMVALHYTRWYAPWLIKTPDAAAYYQPHLKATCRAVYDRNLAAFPALFPRP